MPLAKRAREDARLLRTYLRRGGSAGDFEWVFRDLAQFGEVLRRWDSKPVSQARVFEIGFGARPYRLRAMQAAGADVYGADAEVPLLTGRLSEYRAIRRQNGWERLLKTFVRRLLFDRREQEGFRLALELHGLTGCPLDPGRLLIGDAADVEPPGPFDLIYSIRVFEHIERSSLERLIPRMASWLRPSGLALILPDVFTGLHGAHLLEWEEDTFDLPAKRRAEPWEHLRKRRYAANTTLNEMTRDEYKELFVEHFDILEIIDPPRGRQAEFLTPAVRAELAAYSDEDLLDANPLFVLRPHAKGS